ncbi:hypothetical protein [Pseudolysinimonas sp.]|uniref:hypothetical protein n=1 Tax=Pseudolysinimonas sp. TaxID=2680009 RepID=UPI00286BF2D2|nr:hypothetical protein [Pseudolysinimonas sp.]
MFGDRYGLGWFWHVGMFVGGLIFTAAVVVVAVLLVRYLIVATRAAQLYLDTNSTIPPAAPPSTKPAPRTPKSPPAA